MLKNTKIVGIAAAITLLTGVALAPSATAVGRNLPTLVEGDSTWEVSAGQRVDFSVDYVRTGCNVTFTLGSKTKVEKATSVPENTVRNIGEVADAYITAPTTAGTYTLRARVEKTCKTDGGFSNSGLMTATVTVGDEVGLDEVIDDNGTESELDDENLGNWESLSNGSVRVYGWVSNVTGRNPLTGAAIYGSTEDLGAVKVNFVVKGKTVASAYTDEDGYVNASLEKKYLNNRGTTKVSVVLGSNRVYFADQTFSVERIGG